MELELIHPLRIAVNLGVISMMLYSTPWKVLPSDTVFGQSKKTSEEDMRKECLTQFNKFNKVHLLPLWQGLLKTKLTMSFW